MFPLKIKTLSGICNSTQCYKLEINMAQTAVTALYCQPERSFT